MSAIFGSVRRNVDRQNQAAHVGRVMPLDGLFDQQRAALLHPAKFKALLCGRRAGKTDASDRYLADGLLSYADSLSLYVALTIGSAREIFWEPLRRMNDAHGWGLVFDESKGIVKNPKNGARLLVRGAEDKRELEKLRGMKFLRIVIDECGAHRPSYLQYLLEDVLEPALMDCDGDVILAGTCTVQAYGYFYEITSGLKPGYQVFRWTAKDNPHVNFDRFVHTAETGLLARRGWTVDHPTFRREYLAEWVLDTERLVYRFERARNVVQQLPALEVGDTWEHVMGVDFGVNHATACTVIAYPKRFGRDAYVVHTWRKHGLAPSEAAALIKDTRDRYKPVGVVGDSGGMGKAFMQELARRFPDVGMRPADKQQKRAALEVTSDALYTARQGAAAAERRGLFSLAENEDLHREWASLQWDEQRKEIADGQDDDVSHSALYAFRITPAYSNQTAPVLPEPSWHGTTWEREPRPEAERHARWKRGWYGANR